MKLSDYYISTTGDIGYGDKNTVHSYLESYNNLLEKYEFSTNNILEIGVCRGHSIVMLSNYFKFANIIGAEIDNSLIDNDVLAGILDNVLIMITDATKSGYIDKIDNLDIVIDDGSHIAEDQITTFKLVWPNVNIGGTYIIEDIRHLESFENTIRQDNYFKDIDYFIIDLRKHKNRYDDVLFVFYK